MSERTPVLPGATLGVLGGGQLGRMFAQAAARMGYRVHVYDPQADAPAAQVAAEHTRAAFEDLDAVRRFARAVDAVTLEWESIPLEAVQEAARHAPASPSPRTLALTQDRAKEKTFLAEQGLAVTPFAVVSSVDQVSEAMGRLGEPAVLKTTRGGYDGKGQRKIAAAADAAGAWAELSPDEAVVERWIEFEAELSVIVARGRDGRSVTYGPMRNDHHRHILDHSVLPAELSGAVAREATELATAAAERLELVGVCCVEMFLTGDGHVMINEIAPRPHNSGHLTIEACAASQFEQQARAMCGLPLGDPGLIVGGAAMANLLGDHWPAGGGEPRWAGALAMPRVSLHLYGKRQVREGRKMGHLTAVETSGDEALRRVLAAREAVAVAAEATGSSGDAADSGLSHRTS